MEPPQTEGDQGIDVTRNSTFSQFACLSFTFNFEGVYSVNIHSIQDATTFFVMIYPRPVVISPAGIHQRPSGSIGCPPKIPIRQEVISHIK